VKTQAEFNLSFHWLYTVCAGENGWQGGEQCAISTRSSASAMDIRWKNLAWYTSVSSKLRRYVSTASLLISHA